MNNYKCIYNLRLAGFLMMHGIPIRRIETNLGRRWRNVYLFDNTTKIEELINLYKVQKSNGEVEYVDIKDCKSSDCKFE